MRLYLVNPCNPLVNSVKVHKSFWNRYRVWKPLGLMVLAGLTPPEWETAIIDENLGVPDYRSKPRPDVVGITAFTSQARRAYHVAAEFRSLGVPVVMGGMHATMRAEEALRHVDSVVKGEGERVWPEVLADARRGTLKRVYEGDHADMAAIPPARHDLLDSGYSFGSIQTTRGCPLNCSFCSVTAFNGNRYRHRPVGEVVREFQMIREKRVLVVDDNVIGTRRDHIDRAKDLFRAMIRADLGKQWISQATINMADDEELLRLAVRSGCRGVFIGFESPTMEGLAEVGKKFNGSKGRDFRESVRRIQRHGILVAGSFIMGLDTDRPGIGRQIAEAGHRYGLDSLEVLFFTPLPGTPLWKKMEAENRLVVDAFPEDWQYYTLGFPVARFKHFSSDGILREMNACNAAFYSPRRMFGRIWRNLRHWRRPLITVVGNFSYWNNSRLNRKVYRDFSTSRANGRTTYREGLPWRSAP